MTPSGFSVMLNEKDRATLGVGKQYSVRQLPPSFSNIGQPTRHQRFELKAYCFALNPQGKKGQQHSRIRLWKQIDPKSQFLFCSRNTIQVFRVCSFLPRHDSETWAFPHCGSVAFQSLVIVVCVQLAEKESIEKVLCLQVTKPKLIFHWQKSVTRLPLEARRLRKAVTSQLVTSQQQMCSMKCGA